MKTMDISPVALIIAIFLTMLLSALMGGLGGWKIKPDPLKGKMILIGLRPSSGKGAIRPINAVRGVYTWTEKQGDFKADIDLDSAYQWDDAGLGVKFCEVDLDTVQLIHYEGTAKALIHNGALQKDPADAESQADAGTAATTNGLVQVLNRKKTDAAEVPATPNPLAQTIRYEGVCITDAETVTVDYFGEKRKLKHVWKRLTGTRQYQIRKDTRLKQLAAINSTLWDFLTKALPIMMITMLLLLGTLVVIVAMKLKAGH